MRRPDGQQARWYLGASVRAWMCAANRVAVFMFVVPWVDVEGGIGADFAARKELDCVGL
jgi:hypothetical protein